MSRAEFLTAAKQGKGRALIALRTGDYLPTLHDLRGLVLRWPGCDGQCEESRGWYSVELIRSSPYEEELVDLVLHRFAKPKGSNHDRSHLRAIVQELAKRGVVAAKEALYSHFDPANEFWLGEEIIEVDGLKGLDWVIRHSTAHFESFAVYQFKYWLEELEERIGKEVVSVWLENQAAVRPEVAEFKRLADDGPAKNLQKPRTKVLPPASFERYRNEWKQSQTPRFSPTTWVRHASEEELANAWRAFEVDDAEDKYWLRRLGRALHRKPAVANIDALVERARAWNDEQNPFAWALEEIVDPRVRKLGFELVASGCVADGVSLLASNFEPADEKVILEAIDRMTDDWEVHMTGMDLMNISDKHDCPDLLLWVYQATPCSFCRESAVRDLIEKKAAPEWLLEECRFDCVEETRKMAKDALGPFARKLT